MTSKISPPRATHDDRWMSLCQFFQPEPRFAPAHRHLLPTAFPVSFKFRTNPSQNHRFAFAVMIPSFHREGGRHGDIKWPTRGHTASVFCPKYLLCPDCEFWYTQQILHSRQLDILSCELNPRRGKLVFGHIRFHFMAWSRTGPPFINYYHTETVQEQKSSLGALLLPMHWGGPSLSGFARAWDATPVPPFSHPSFLHPCTPHSPNSLSFYVSGSVLTLGI